MGDINLCSTTPCGHRYCRGCILQCLASVNSRCPCCNSGISAKALIKDRQFDALIDKFKKAKKTEAEREYIAQVLNRERDADLSTFFSPVEEVLREHMGQTLMTHHTYYQDLKRHRDKVIANIGFECDRHVSMVSIDLPGRDDVIKTIRQTFAEQKNQIDKKLCHIVKYIAAAYKSYLQKMPDLAVIPLDVSIVILCKDLILPSVVLRPDSKVKDIKKAAEEAVSSCTTDGEKDAILSWGDDVQVVALEPFMPWDTMQMKQAVADIVAGTHVDHVVLVPNDTPLLNLGVMHGSQIVIAGSVMFNSDRPKQCFVCTYDNQNPQAMDYFSCKSCDKGWICRPCIDACHKGHDVALFVSKHLPGWACCYCKKTKHCQL